MLGLENDERRKKTMGYRDVGLIKKHIDWGGNAPEGVLEVYSTPSSERWVFVWGEGRYLVEDSNQFIRRAMELGKFPPSKKEGGIEYYFRDLISDIAIWEEKEIIVKEEKIKIINVQENDTWARKIVSA